MKESWDNIFEEAPASFEARMRETLAGLEEKPNLRRLRFPRSGLIAAALAAAILGGTALAANLFGLHSLTVDDPFSTPTAQGDVIALQGLPESPEFQANARWMAYLANRPPVETTATPEATDAAVVDLPEETPGNGGAALYPLYSVDSEESARMLESIVTEYGLRLHTTRWDFYDEKGLNDLLDTTPFLTGCSAVVGYVYEDGSFQADGTSVGGRTYEYQIGRYVKGTFSEVTLNVGNTGDYEEWIYTTAGGMDVQLSLGPDRSLLLADLDNAFVAVNLQGGAKGNALFMPDPLTREQLEAFAETIDFTQLG